MIRTLFLTLTAMGAWACSSADDVEAKLGVEAEAAVKGIGSGTNAGTADRAAPAVAVEEETKDYVFEYAYPAQAAAIPALEAHLREKLANARAELADSAAADRESAAADGFPFKPHGSAAKWQVVTDLPRFLSLSGEFWSYTGGAHGNYGFGALVWDRQENTQLDPKQMFTSPAALDEAIRPGFCEMLDVERAERRGQPVDKADEYFSACPSVEEMTVILGSSDGRNFDRIGLLIDPYVAGPYAEGSYEFTLPVTRAMRAAVKPQFRDAFAVKG